MDLICTLLRCAQTPSTCGNVPANTIYVPSK